jgi:hypothetical protein
MRALIRLLLLAGAGLVAVLLWFGGRELLEDLTSGEMGEALFLASVLAIPVVLSLGGAFGARALARRGSGWAVPVAGVPLTFLLLGLGLSLYLWLNPVSFSPVR